jgi:hypothetical protein
VDCIPIVVVVVVVIQSMQGQVRNLFCFVLCVCVCVCVCFLQAFRSYIFKSFFRSYLFKSVFEEEQEASDLAISKTDLELLMIFMKQNSCNEGFFVCFLFIISL